MVIIRIPNNELVTSSITFHCSSVTVDIDSKIQPKEWSKPKFSFTLRSCLKGKRHYVKDVIKWEIRDTFFLMSSRTAQSARQPCTNLWSTLLRSARLLLHPVYRCRDSFSTPSRTEVLPPTLSGIEVFFSTMTRNVKFLFYSFQNWSLLFHHF